MQLYLRTNQYWYNTTLLWIYPWFPKNATMLCVISLFHNPWYTWEASFFLSFEEFFPVVKTEIQCSFLFGQYKKKILQVKYSKIKNPFSVCVDGMVQVLSLLAVLLTHLLSLFNCLLYSKSTVVFPYVTCK